MYEQTVCFYESDIIRKIMFSIDRQSLLSLLCLFNILRSPGIVRHGKNLIMPPVYKLLWVCLVDCIGLCTVYTVYGHSSLHMVSRVDFILIYLRDSLDLLTRFMCYLQGKDKHIQSTSFCQKPVSYLILFTLLFNSAQQLMTPVTPDITAQLYSSSFLSYKSLFFTTGLLL